MSGLQLFDALPAHIEAALRASIERFGVLVPVVVDQDGRTLDGHHRRRIAAEVGAECPTRTVEVADDDEAREVARTLNADRRHLTEDQRRQVAADLRREGHSLRAIAGALGVSEPTVRRDIAKSGASCDAPEPEPAARVIGMDGKSYPATRPAPEPEPEAARVIEFPPPRPRPAIERDLDTDERPVPLPEHDPIDRERADHADGLVRRIADLRSEAVMVGADELVRHTSRRDRLAESVTPLIEWLVEARNYLRGMDA